MIQPLRYLTLIALLFLSGFVQAQPAAESVSSLEQAIDEKNFLKASILSYEIGKSSADAQRVDDAIKYLKSSISYANKAGSFTQSLLASLVLGEVLFTEKKFSEAEKNFEKAVLLARKEKRPELEVQSLMMQAQCLGHLERYRRSIEVLDQAVASSLENNFSDAQLRCYELLSKYHRLSRNEKKALEFEKMHAKLASLLESERIAAAKLMNLQNEVEAEKDRASTQEKKLQQAEVVLSGKSDSLFSATKSLRQVEQSLKQLEDINQKRQLEIDLLNKDKELSHLRIQEQNSRLENEELLRNFILAVIFLGATLAVVVFINSRKTVAVNKKLDLQNKNIKSSINYAKRIQEAMLPKQDTQENLLKHSFMYFKPRDVVSGDFYWISPVRSRHNSTETAIAFGALDCTGHGVPGAFMSMIGINSLTNIVNRGVSETNRILELLHLEIRSALQQELTGNNDGMDAALCIYRSDKRRLEFSGAKNPLVYIQNNELHQIKGDIHPIGGSRARNDFSFRKHEIPIETETMIYLFTDGFRDQFGGSENQKFMSKRFTKLLLEIHQLPLEEQRQKLQSVFEEWKGSNEQTDDVLVMGIKLIPG
jgi:serine phosphatase RsbU (regulator of sigma subunit)